MVILSPRIKSKSTKTVLSQPKSVVKLSMPVGLSKSNISPSTVKNSLVQNVPLIVSSLGTRKSKAIVINVSQVLLPKSV